MLHVHRAARADRLVAALADELATPLPDPLATELIAVHSRGIERWIAQELSAHLGTGALGSDGVCANVAFPFPGKLIRDAVAAGSGIDPELDPWLPERLTWPLLTLVDEHDDPDLLGPLRTHVAPDPAAGANAPDTLARRLGAVRHVADLFDRYGVHRPEMVCRWADGADVGPDGAPLPTRHRWQPTLWRAVRERLDLPSFAERRAAALAALRADPDLLDLPPRLAMFGLTALPATYLEVVAAIGAHRDLHLMLLHPSRDLWERIAEVAPTATGAAPVLPSREDDPTAALPHNPLLASWGRDVRELQLVAPLDDARVHHHDADPADPRTLLQRLQADVRHDRHPGAPSAPDAPLLAPDDRSVQLHDCHGRLRQVEVVRDAILHLLADTPDLEPRDVIVMCPDIETFAPLVTAVFGADAVVHEHASATTSTDDPDLDDDAVTIPADAPPALRVRLADRSLRRTNPVLDVVSEVLDLVDGRVTASAVLDLIGREPVRRRFGFGEDDIDTLETWIADLGIRWGLDAEHRRRHGLPELDAHTWRAGLERLLLGAAMADEDLRLVEGVVPYDGVEGQATDLAGRLVELVARLEEALDTLVGARPVDAWHDAVSAVADRLTTTAVDDSWQRLQLHRILDELVAEATVAGEVTPVELTLAELRTTLSERLAGRPSTTSHRTGDLTISTLVPMRSVPHRVVCLLGLDDGAFPRQTVADSDDLLNQAPRVGDRDPRSEDRQLLLDALLAATETLIVTYAGRDDRTNEPRPPAVPVDELRDVIDRTVAVDDGRRARDHVTVVHPLAQHDPRNFQPGLRPGDERPWGFDPTSLAAAKARRAAPSAPRPFLADPLPALDEDVIDLDDLVAFLQHPAKAFVKRRLEVTLPGDEEATSDAIPSTLEALDAWKVGDPMLQEWLRGTDLDRSVEVLRARGMIPPGDLATDGLAKVRGNVDGIVTLCERIEVAPGPRQTVDVEVVLPDGRTLVGSVPDVASRGRITSVSYSRLAPKHRLATWVRYLAVTAQEPDAPWQAVTVGRHPWSSRWAAQAQLLRPAAQLRDHPDPAVYATVQLTRLLELYDLGMRSPLPLYCATSAKVAENLAKDKPAEQYVNREWETRPNAPFPCEDRDPYHLLVLGGQRSTDALLAEPCADRHEAAWVDDHRRVVAYAWRLWEPLLEAEKAVQG